MSRRPLRRVAITVAAVFVVWLSLCLIIVQRPVINQVVPVDVIVVVGPSDAPRLDMAQQLLRRGVARQVVVSVPAEGYLGSRDFCARPPVGVTATCFTPSPFTTRGEAEAVARMAAIHHWSSLLVVTSKYHVSRARMIFDRCVEGRVVVVSSGEYISPWRWAYEYAYQTAGYTRAFIQRDC